jgi:hypothetical protein
MSLSIIFYDEFISDFVTFIFDTECHLPIKYHKNRMTRPIPFHPSNQMHQDFVPTLAYRSNTLSVLKSSNLQPISTPR